MSLDGDISDNFKKTIPWLSGMVPNNVEMEECSISLPPTPTSVEKGDEDMTDLCDPKTCLFLREPLRDYQLEFVNWALKLEKANLSNGGILADEPGLGTHTFDFFF